MTQTHPAIPDPQPVSRALEHHSPPGGADPASNRILIFDTTMRDGEQAPGFSMSRGDKVLLGRALKDLGVDIIEAGFAASSPGDEDSVRAVAGEVSEDDRGPVVCSLSRAVEGDIDAAWRALKGTQRRRVHVFIGTSPIHRAAKLQKTAGEVLTTAVRAVAHARTMFDDIEFSAEDAFRTEPDFLADIFEAVAAAGATTLNVPDTVGYAMPGEVASRFRSLCDRMHRTRPDIVFSSHCHDDLGMAAANTLAAIEGGARQVETTVNGIGERAGNASLEEVVMALRVRARHLCAHTHVDTTRLLSVSRLLSRLTGSPVARNKAIVGANAFSHEAGIHQHGMLADSRTYEVMRPQDVGFEKSRLVLGKHSGRHAIARRAEVLGYPLAEGQLSAAFAAFKARADEIGEIDDAELMAICSAAQATETPDARA